MIPDYILEIIKKLADAGYEAYIVGGPVRDLLRGKAPTDWDITTSARPDDMLKLFEDSEYQNQFGTVMIKVRQPDGEVEAVVEATTYRSEQGYSDRRHPDQVKFEDSLDKDLMRRDFTVNALALRPAKPGESEDKHRSLIEIDNEAYELVDYFGGRQDMKQKIIRAVGEPADRFKEDALRMMRAVRFVCQLDFKMEPKTERAIAKMPGAIKFIAKERIKDELIKILKSDKPAKGFIKLHETGLLNYIIPELESGVGVEQNHHHIYTVFDHDILSLKHCPSDDWRVRLAALLHDIGKPKTKRIVKGQGTFHNHEIVGANMARKIMRRLKFANADIDKVYTLIKHHMFYYNVDEVTATSVRRLIRKVGEENLKDLIDLRIADRLGSGTPKAKPYKLRHLEYMFDKVRHDPVSTKMLAINGNDLMQQFSLEPGPKIGGIMDVLLSRVIEDPSLNQKDELLSLADKLKDKNLEELREAAKDKIEEVREEEDRQLRRSHKVK